MVVFADRDCGGAHSSVELWTPEPEFEHTTGPVMRISGGAEPVRSYSVHCPYGSERWPPAQALAHADVVRQLGLVLQ